MILLVDTSTPLAKLVIVVGADRYEYEWRADRQLAHSMLAWLRDCLAKQSAEFGDITGIGALRGPGSFTGLRIGLTVLNTLSDSLGIPIVGVTGDGWQELALQRLSSGENDKIVLPLYDREANITKPRK